MSRRKTTEQWVKEVLEKYPENAEKYDYTKTVYVNSKTRVIITCKKHGDFEQEANCHHNKGYGCPECYKENNPRADTLESFIAKAKEKHGDAFDYSHVVYVNSTTKVNIICNTCGEIFEQTPAKHVFGRGCPHCANKVRGYKSRNDFKEVVDRAVAIHGDKYTYLDMFYKDEGNERSRSHLSVKCNRCGSVFEQAVRDHLRGGGKATGCPHCAKLTSKPETEMFEFVKSLCPDAVQSDRTVLSGRELDIFIPSKKLAIECNGVYWHCDSRKVKNYHHDKFLACKEKGVRLIQITDYEWVNDKTTFKKLISHALGVGNQRRINARDCNVVELLANECKNFYNNNHPQGHASNPANFALQTKDGEIVAIMSFGFGKTTRGSARSSGACEAVWELSRYATACCVRGGASKLFKAFIKKYNPTQVRSFSMNDWFSGGLYETLGFTGEPVEPDYRVFHEKNGLLPKSRWQRRCIPQRLKEIEREDLNFNPDKSVDPRTEFEMEDLVGALRIWDSGKTRWTWRNNEKKINN